MREQLMNWTLSKYKTSVLKIGKGMEDKPQAMNKYLQITYLTKNLYPECIKNSRNSILTQITSPKNEQKILTDTLLQNIHG